jgi:hypothetical protein
LKPSRTSAGRAASYARSNPPVRMAVDLGAFDSMISELEQEIDAAVRPAAQAGAEVIYQAVLRNVDAMGKVTGNLHDAIYQAFVEKDSVPTANGYQRAAYDVSWNHRIAPHAHMIEYGHIQRYAVHLGDDGKWYTLVRPEMRGKKKPGRRASQAVKDAYYIPRAGGPQQIAAKPFMRPAFYKQGDAVAAVEAKFWDVLGAVKQ